MEYMVIAILLGAVSYAALRRVEVAAPAAGAVVGIWFCLPAALANQGLLTDFSSVPPPLLRLVFSLVVLGVVLVLSPLGKRLSQLPLAGLVALQGFRLPLELAMHRSYEQGLMPVQMSYSGLNFDIITGVTALALGLALYRGRVAKGWIWAWNVLGLLLLLNIVVIAILSTPVPFRQFHNEPANTFVTTFPYVWLPTVMVQVAWVGHLLIFRRLLGSR